MTLYLGVDPGLGGALAFFSTDTNCLDVYDMPTFSVLVKGKPRRKLDRKALHGILASRPSGYAVLELVHAMPRQGVTSAFTFGEVYGATAQCLVSNSWDILHVLPRVWKGHFGLSADKDASRALATAKFPMHADLFERKKNDGRAEAALMALYGFWWSHWENT